MDIKADEKRFPDPIVEELINYPDQIQICDEIGLENLKPRDNVILLSKPPFGPPLYWHQDFMNWDHPEAACPWPTVIFLSYYMNDTSVKMDVCASYQAVTLNEIDSMTFFRMPIVRKYNPLITSMTRCFRIIPIA